MLVHIQLPQSLWGEAMMSAVHTLNCSPTSTAPMMTPYQAYLGTKPDVSHFYAFDCNALAPTKGALLPGVDAFAVYYIQIFVTIKGMRRDCVWHSIESFSIVVIQKLLLRIGQNRKEWAFETKVEFGEANAIQQLIQLLILVLNLVAL